VIVVDDASTDDTMAMLHREFAEQLTSGNVRLVQLGENRGVSEAKNVGYGSAKGEWVLFLDSDDTLLADASNAVVEVLAAHQEAPLVFFRCVDQNGAFVGHHFATAQHLALPRYLRYTSYGEALVALNRLMVPEAPFDGDLRGYEGMGCARLIRQHGAALLSTVIARRYDRSGADRLSSAQGFLARSTLIAKGHLRLITTFWRDMSPVEMLTLIGKSMIYYLAGIGFKVWKAARG
jgi:glycosyltransferase involved in cell wall biosynthesis